MQACRTRYRDVPREGHLNHTPDSACRVRMEVRMYSVLRLVPALRIATKKATVAMTETETTVETVDTIEAKIDSKNVTNGTRQQIHQE